MPANGSKRHSVSGCDDNVRHSRVLCMQCQPLNDARGCAVILQHEMWAVLMHIRGQQDTACADVAGQVKCCSERQLS